MTTIILIYILGVITAALITAYDVYEYLIAAGSPHTFWQVLETMIIDPHVNFLYSWWFVIERIIEGE